MQLATSTMITTTTHVRLTSAHPFTPEFVQRQLLLLPATGAKSKSRAQARALYDERVRRRQLILAPKAPIQRPRRSSKKTGGADDDARMGRREAAEKGLWRLRKEEARWELFVPLHRLWLGYMSELLGLAAPPPTPTLQVDHPLAMSQAAGMHAKLLKADFHGSIVTVRRSKNAALVGASGIVVQETENTFKVVTQKDKLKVLPKQGSVFVFAVPLYHTGTGTNDPATGIVATARSSGSASKKSGGEKPTTVLDGVHAEFELYGNQFCFRATDRAGRKFKHKESIEL
ncbi:RNase P/MRP p29 subunit [Lactarius indigo]|nr:RNase P/MRP p29 subunit [Lactarius indigo]